MTKFTRTIKWHFPWIDWLWQTKQILKKKCNLLAYISIIDSVIICAMHFLIWFSFFITFVAQLLWWWFSKLQKDSKRRIHFSLIGFEKSLTWDRSSLGYLFLSPIELVNVRKAGKSTNRPIDLVHSFTSICAVNARHIRRVIYVWYFEIGSGSIYTFVCSFTGCVTLYANTV